MARTIGHQHIKPRIIIERQFGADHRLDADICGGLMKARRAIKAVAVAQRDCAVA